MRVGTAARRWGSLEPTPEQYRRFRETLDRHSAIEETMELCYIPFDMAEGLRRSVADPPATLLVLPNGWVKVAAALPHVCADLRATGASPRLGWRIARRGTMTHWSRRRRRQLPTTRGTPAPRAGI
jgi:hypothetical protein